LDDNDDNNNDDDDDDDDQASITTKLTYEIIWRFPHQSNDFSGNRRLSELPALHCVSKNDTDIPHYNFNAHQPILVILACC